MTEELEKEAEEYAKERAKILNIDDHCLAYHAMQRAYRHSAEPREKRIAELEAQIEKMKCCGNCKFRDCNKSSQYQTCWYCKNKDKWELRR